MHRVLLYIGLFTALMLLQVFLFDNLTLCVYLNPLIYIAFVILLPLDTQPAALLGLGLLTGVSMDWLMGAAGLNTLATLPVAFLRPWILGLVTKHEDFRDGGVPCPERLGGVAFLRYLILTVVLHHTLFFVFEALSWTHLVATSLRIVIGSVVSIGFIYLITRLFTSKFTIRI